MIAFEDLMLLNHPEVILERVRRWWLSLMSVEMKTLEALGNVRLSSDGRRMRRERRV